MSRIGKKPIHVPLDVTVTKPGKESVTVRGPKGELTIAVPIGVTLAIGQGTIGVEANDTDKKMKALHGLLRSILANAVMGVTKGWTKTLELSGVGYRASLEGDKLILTLGFSHPVTIEPPEGIAFEITEGKIHVAGIDKRLVGLTAASIRDMKKPEPYKGKGIHYEGEYIRRKAGKAKVIGGAPGMAK